MTDFKGINLQKKDFFSPRMITNFLFSLALLVIILVNLFSFFQVSKFANANQWVIHTYRIIQAVNQGLLSLLKIESAARNFIITNNQSALQDLDVDKSVMNQNFSMAKKLSIDNQLQQEKIVHIELMLHRRMELIEKLIQSGLKQDKNLQLPLVHQGGELTNKISSMINEINSTELQLLQQRNESVLNNLNQLNQILVITSIASILFFIVGIIILNINLVRRRLFLQDKLRYQNLLKGIIESTQDIIVVLDINLCFVIFNRSFEEEFKSLFGKAPRLGASIVETLAHMPNEQKKIESLWQRALQGEEFSFIDKFGGTPFNQNTYECNFNPIYDENGELMGASAISRNIEHRIVAEKSLKAVNENLVYANNELKHRNSDISLLNEMENALQSCRSISETFIIISKYCHKLLPFTRGVIFLINSSRNYLEDVGEWNSPKVIEKVFAPSQCWGLRQGKNYTYINNSTSISCEHMQSQNISSYICVPLLAQNDVIGLLHIEIIDDKEASEVEISESYNKQELLFKNLAVQLALAIANIQLRETLRTRSIRDPLTDLYNRAYLNEFLERDLDRSKRNNIPVSLVMMDIDHFKKLNDKYGHDAGDLALKELGKLLKENIRGSDFACRYGGEEFLLIFYDTSTDTAIERVEKIRLLISQMEVILRGTVLDKITASFGLAVFPKDGPKLEALITAADQALMHAKKNGRNQLQIYSQP